MTEEIKEIMNGNREIRHLRIEGETIGFDTQFNDNWNFMPRDIEQIIDTLQQENTQLKKRVDMYENPEDLTLMFMYCDEKAKDKIKHLTSVLKEIREKINFYKTTEWGLRGHSILETFEEIIDKGIGE